MYPRNPVYYREFRHIQAHSRSIQTYRHGVVYLEPCVVHIFRTLPYSESWHIQNPRYIQNSAMAYTDIQNAV